MRPGRDASAESFGASAKHTGWRGVWLTQEFGPHRRGDISYSLGMGRSCPPSLKAQIVLEVLREEKSIAQLANTGGGAFRWLRFR